MSDFKPTNEQRAILAHDVKRSARVLAGPGTGKSATLVAYLNKLLEADSKHRVKLLTFTRAATGELATKVSAHSATGALRPSTIHSFAISVLLMNPGAADIPQPLRIADDWEDRWLVRPSLAKRIEVDLKRVGVLITELESNWQSLHKDDDPEISAKERARFIGAWQENRHVWGYTLLAELPFALLNALRDHPDLKGLKYDLLIVDEYQDLNACDLEALKLITARGCRLIAAGDDDQSIYGFRKAAPEGIRRFLKDYSKAADYTLTITQRCGSNIATWANHVISGDPERPANRGTLMPAESSPEGESALLSFADDASEAEGTAALIERLVKNEKVPPREILVLLRGDHNGSFSRPLRDELEAKGIPFSDPSAVGRMLGEDANRRFLSLARLLIDREDSLAWGTQLYLEDGIGDSFLDYVYDIAKDNRERFASALLAAYEKGFPAGPKSSSKKAASLLKGVLRWLEKNQAQFAGRDEGWGKWLVKLVGDGVIPAPTDELRELLLALDNLVEPKTDLQRFLSQIAPLGKDRAQAESEGVRIMTMGSSKGLTVRATVLMGVDDGIMPHPNGNLAEERRLLYVAMTRSKEFLFGTWARRRTGPSAWSGEARVGKRRTFCQFLQGGPVESQDGLSFIRNRWRRADRP